MDDQIPSLGVPGGHNHTTIPHTPFEVLVAHYTLFSLPRWPRVSPCGRITDVSHSGRGEVQALILSELRWGGSPNIPYAARSAHAS